VKYVAVALQGHINVALPFALVISCFLKYAALPLDCPDPERVLHYWINIYTRPGWKLRFLSSKKAQHSAVRFQPRALYNISLFLPGECK
jgi:hypothetical protein